MPKIYIIGMGPGALEYLAPAAVKQIEKADCLIADRRLVSTFKAPAKKKIFLEAGLNKAILYIKKNWRKEKIAVLVSGDPGLYSFSEFVKEAVKKENCVVIPGITSLQFAFARIGEDWQDALILSLHGRDIDDLAGRVRAAGKVFLLTDYRRSPDRIAGRLLKEGIENRRAVVFENLSCSDERIIDASLKKISRMKGFKLCVMVIKK